MPAGQIIKTRRGTAAAWTSANPTLAAGEPGYETDTGKIKIGDGSTAWTGLAYRFTNALSLTETGGPTTLTIGAIPDGDYLVRSGSTIIGGSPTPGGPPTGAAGGGLSGTYPNPSVTAKIGSTALVYRYTVAGSDKASIDTGVDTPDAGSNDWTNGDLLEVGMYLRTDEAVADSGISLNVNNDTAAHYDRQYAIIATGLLAGQTNAASACSFGANGANKAAGYFSTCNVRIVNYAGTVGNKTIELFESEVDTTTTEAVGLNAYGWRSTAAIIRLAITPATSGKKFKVGSQILVYKRLAS